MAHPRIAVGLSVHPQPPYGTQRMSMLFARLLRLDTLLVTDDLQGYIPRALWNKEVSWIVGRRGMPHTPHEVFEYQTLLGHLAAHAGRMRLGVGVTEPIRRHPVLLAQAMLTLAHLTRRPPILGIGAGARENTEPYGLDLTARVNRLEEALQIIQLCFTSQGPLDFYGQRYQLDHAPMDLKAPSGRTPEIWVGAYGPRMLRLTGQYGDGWYPNLIASPEEYATKLAVVRATAREVGRDPHAITPSLHQVIVVAPSEAEAMALLGTKLARLVSVIDSTAEDWRKVGLAHPFGEQYRGYFDFIPEQYDRATLEEALAVLPGELLGYRMIWGTPEQVVSQLRLFGEAGMRHVVLLDLTLSLSRSAAVYALQAIPRIAWHLQSGR